MADMMDLNDPTICTYCHQRPHAENSAVCEPCGRSIEAIDMLKAETFNMAKVLENELQKKEEGVSG